MTTRPCIYCDEQLGETQLLCTTTYQPVPFGNESRDSRDSPPPLPGEGSGTGPAPVPEPGPDETTCSHVCPDCGAPVSTSPCPDCGAAVRLEGLVPVTLRFPDGTETTLSSGGSVVLGREGDAPAAAALAAYGGVSRLHARLEVRPGEVTISDLRSCNGTTVAGVTLKGESLTVPLTGPLPLVLGRYAVVHLIPGRSVSTRTTQHPPQPGGSSQS